jgi:hypothetical protein
VAARLAERGGKKRIAGRSARRPRDPTAALLDSLY